jgi:hypothetical protein
MRKSKVGVFSEWQVATPKHTLRVSFFLPTPQSHLTFQLSTVSERPSRVLRTVKFIAWGQLGQYIKEGMPGMPADLIFRIIFHFRAEDSNEKVVTPEVLEHCVNLFLSIHRSVSFSTTKHTCKRNINGKGTR